MRIIHRVDLTEAGDVAVLDIDARDIVFALVLCLSAVFLKIVDRLGRDQQARVLLRRDLCLGLVQAQHVPVDGIAGQHKAGQIVFLINGHFGDGGGEGVFHLAGEADLHRAAQRPAVAAQKLFALLGRAHTRIPPCKTGHDLAGTSVQRQHRVGIQIAFQLLCAQGKDVIRTCIEPPAACRPHKIAGLRSGDLRRRAQLRLHTLRLLGQGRDLIDKVCRVAGHDPELILRQKVGVGIRIHRLVIGGVQRIHQVIQRRRAVLQQHIQLQRRSVLRFLQQCDLIGQLGQLLAQNALGGIAVDLCHCRACRDTLAVGGKVAHDAAACHIALVKQQHTVGADGIRHGCRQRGLVNILRKEHMESLVSHIAEHQHQKNSQHPHQRRQRAAVFPSFLRFIRHVDHPFAKNSSVLRSAVSAASGAPASSQTTPSI